MLGSLISALGSLASGLFGRSAAKDAQQNQMAMAQQNIQLQREFAQNGIQWRVDDANKAGVHPLAALGAQTMSFSPVSISGDVDTSMSTAMSNIGQDLGRAINATRTDNQRSTAYEKSLRDLQLTNAQLDVDIKRADLASRLSRLNQQSAPPMPTDGVSEIPLPREKPSAIKNLYFGGRKFEAPPDTSSAQDVEDALGDDGPGSFLANLAVGYNWLKHNWDWNRIAEDLPGDPPSGNWLGNMFPDNARRAAARRQRSIDTHRRTMGRW